MLDPAGKMLVHPDSTLQGRSQLDMKDVNGRPIIQGLIAAATTFPKKPEGWYHYQWLKDLNGKALAREYIAAAMRDGSAWVDYYWYKPGHNTPSRKQAFVRKVQYDGDTYIVGSGLYINDDTE